MMMTRLHYTQQVCKNYKHFLVGNSNTNPSPVPERLIILKNMANKVVETVINYFNNVPSLSCIINCLIPKNTAQLMSLARA